MKCVALDGFDCDTLRTIREFYSVEKKKIFKTDLRLNVMLLIIIIVSICDDYV